MSNITDIQLSGSTYEIRDKSATTFVSLTQAEYDALPSSAKTDATKVYIISDAQAGDLTNYYTKSETSGATEISTALNAKADTATTYTKTEVDNAITAATSTKQDTLVSGTNIKTINNESILGSGNITIQGGGGGKAVSGGTNISITTGATADTINCTLPISRGGSGYNSLSLGNMSDATEEGAVSYGYHSVAYGAYALAGGSSSNANGNNSVAIGSNVTTNNDKEFSVGQYNLSSSASTNFGDSGNTLFSVGNGEYSNHNAIEVRQNGDIYISDTSASGEFDEKPMIKLQDALGQGGGGMDDDMERLISTSLVDLNDRKADKTQLAKYQTKGNYATKSELDAKANLSEVMTLAKATENEQVTASALNELNNKFGGLSLVKITESEYSALSTKDENTLYIVIADPS